ACRVLQVQGRGSMSDLDEVRLAQWLARSLQGVSRITSLEKFPGGQSNPTYRLESDGNCYVFRRKPFGKLFPSAHAVDREFRLLTALKPEGFPVPRPIVLCEDENVIGAMFYLMEMVEGRTYLDGTLPQQDTGKRRAYYAALVDTIAQLHSIDILRIGLGDFGA